MGLWRRTARAFDFSPVICARGSFFMRRVRRDFLAIRSRSALLMVYIFRVALRRLFSPVLASDRGAFAVGSGELHLERMRFGSERSSGLGLQNQIKTGWKQCRDQKM
jgi:hypothetical protein